MIFGLLKYFVSGNYNNCGCRLRQPARHPKPTVFSACVLLVFPVIDQLEYSLNTLPASKIKALAVYY